MKKLLALLAVVAVAACQDNPLPMDVHLQETAAPQAAPLLPANAQSIPDRYIVVFRDDVVDPAGTARGLVRAAGGNLHFTYRTALKGFAATIPAPAVTGLRNNPNVQFIEPDGEVFAVAPGSQPGATWGLDRIDQRSGLDGVYNWNTSGEGVTVYVLDTGIRFTHSEFEGRASFGFDAFNDGQNGNDCNGHGTHVSGTVAGATWGVAKDADLVAVRVLNCSGSGTMSGVIAGIDWVTANRSLPAVANMSLSGYGNASLDQAVRNSITSGVTYAVAASNDNYDACFFSPARVAEAMTLGATDSLDRRAWFSNYGSCVDYFAPGVSITSAGISSDYATAIGSGTSMASPHAAGVAALYLEENPGAAPAAVFDAIKAGLTLGVVVDARSANNHLLYSLITTGGPPPPNEPPTADFTYSCTGLQCSFTDQSTDPDGTIGSWGWDFGDGGTSALQNPTHNFPVDGIYSVTLTVTDDDGASDSELKLVTVADIPNQPPTADFTFSCTGLGCSFTDQSTDPDGTVGNWNWDFGDGGTSALQNPTHTFPTDGTYSVTLTVTDDDGATDAITKSVTVADIPNQPPTADFTFSCTGLQCSFTDQSTDPDGTVGNWGWDFGDGGTSALQNPTHTFPAGGTYSVTLTVTDDDGATDSETKAVTVTEPSGIDLTVAASKDRGRLWAVLRWTGATTPNVDIYRNGALRATTANTGLYSDYLGKPRNVTYVYRVCEAGTSVCSDPVSISF